MTPKSFRKIVSNWRLAEYRMGMSLPLPMTSKEIESFLKKLPFSVPKKCLRYSFEFGGKFEDPYAEVPDSLIPGNFNKHFNLGEFYLETGKGIVLAHSDLCRVSLSGDFDGLDPDPHPGVESNWFNERWLPIASNGVGDYLCLDFAPTPHGSRGQVIVFAHESPLRPKLADDIDTFFDQLADTYKKELIYLTDDDYDLRKMRQKDFPSL